MEVYVNANDGNITLEGIKDPVLKTKLIKLTETYLSGLYKELSLSKSGAVMSLGFSGVMMLEPKKESCCICMVGCNNVKDVVVVPDCGCLHKYYHEDCLRRWFRIKKICPTCNKRCNGRGYRRYTWENPYGSNISKNPGWQCCGGTHRKKSTFKSLPSALKHANVMHHVNIVKSKRDGSDVWVCNIEGCIEHVIHSDEETLRHLISHHRINVICEK